jgi:hypothetical protein
MSSNHDHDDQRSTTMTFPTPPPSMTEAQIDAGIDEAWTEAIRIGLLVPTGETKWSERKQCLMPVYRRTAKKLNQPKRSFETYYPQMKGKH